MSKGKKKMLVPKLRFQEFRAASEWKANSLGEIYDFKVTNSFSRDMLNYENGSVKNIHYGDIHTKYSTLFSIKNECVPFVNPSVPLDKIKHECYCIEGDIIFADASEDLADIGKCIELVDLNNERLISGLHTILARQKQSKMVLGFGGHLFKSQRIRKQIQKESQGAKVLGLSAGRLEGIEVAYPSDKKEQQKIADCISSIDELITAQSQNVEALKTHKKGMMQQLFPREGENIPRLRFPKFRNVKEWDSTTFGKAATFINGKAYKQEELLEIGKYRVLRVGNFFTNKEWYFSDLDLDEDKYCDKGDLLYAWSASFGPRIWAGEKVIYHYHIWKVVEAAGINKLFLFVLLDHETERMKAESANGLGLLHITKGAIEGWECSIPQKEEQEQIAGCLSSIDELISAHTQKLEMLKTHKKGLMQQLFLNEDKEE